MDNTMTKEEKLQELEHKALEYRNWLTSHPHADIETIRHHRQQLQELEEQIRQFDNVII